eukprot:scaffold10856_cov229-Amphora_coffeaeformis.AAC.33
MNNFFIYLVYLLSSVGFTTCQILENTALWEQASAYAKSLDMDAAVVEKLKAKDVGTLHQIGKHKLKQRQSSKDQKSGLEILHALADDPSQPHIPSQVSLGFHYYQTNKMKALQYFADAGEEGPHQAALYNAGRLYGELGEWTPALAYIRAATTLGETNPEAVTESLTETCLAAYEIMMQQLSQQTLSIQQSADVFLYSNLHDFPPDGSDQANLWRNAVMALDSFNRTFSESDGQNQNKEDMMTTFSNLHKLWETSSTQLSALQAYILLQHANDMLGMLAGLDDSYIPAAAGYSEALALSPYCYQWAAASEEERSCFNEAAVAAVAYYRRVNDLESALRVVELGRAHPSAATHWDTLEQTPRVYHSGLTSKPWWTMEEFPTAVALAKAYETNKASILQELRNVQALQEGLHPSGYVEVGADGSTGEGADFGFRRISTPYIGLRVNEESTRTKGAGGWSEFGPLFDGRGWKADMCAYTPTLCQVIREDPSSLCTHHASPDTVEDVLQKYGTDTLVTLLRLRPGTHILPHNGTTNRRLIMHLCLEGCEGIQFTVGGKMVESYGGGDGSVIVFDDSFEHSVYHAGKQDRFVLVTVFAHPESIAS